MKKLIASISIVVISVTFLLAKPSCPAHSWTLTITPDTKKTDLDSVSVAWKKDNVVLTFSTLDYNTQGKLTKVKGSVDINLGEKKHASGTFANGKALTTIEIKVDDRPGVSIKVK